MMAAERGPMRVVGRYALYAEIASGGMATVHIGRLLGPVGFARTVAIKRLHPQYAKDPEFVSMFLDEARLAARVQHPNVVATIDVVATEGELFLIMDYVRGESLSKLLRVARKHKFAVPPRIAAAIMCGFLHGLHAAHEAKNERGEPLGLVHRDVSPQNVLVGSDGIARVLDFGVAKAAGRVQVTKDGQIKGKLAYMPPEQLSASAVTRAVDIYASAVVLWETLTGERLFKGESESETLAKILRDPVMMPSMFGVPEAFDPPIMRALSRDIQRRHPTARAFALEVERCVGIASPTEVGEWVEALVGQTLDARERQIAEIESASTNVRIGGSGRPEPSSDSDSDVSGLPQSLAHLQPPRSSRGNTSVMHSPSSSQRLAAVAAEDSRVTGSKSATSLTLPTDKKLPVLATLLGVGVLLVIVAVVVAGKFRGALTDAAEPAPSASAAASAVETPPSAVPVATDSAASSASGVASALPIPSATATHTAPHPTATTHSPPAAPAPAPTKKPNCDPNYTIDANGHKKYKLECM
ncbi:MAG TPA: serine/threonine-protein kinase [Labilithrix sp.]|jgi:serine/threonine-protein kinase